MEIFTQIWPFVASFLILIAACVFFVFYVAVLPNFIAKIPKIKALFGTADEIGIIMLWIDLHGSLVVFFVWTTVVKELIF